MTRFNWKTLGALTMVLLFSVLLLLAPDEDDREEWAVDVHFPASDYDPHRFPAPGAPLVGTNYTHYSFAGCDWDSKSILHEYHRPEVARAVHNQLMVMREEGIDALRMIIWHMTDIPGQQWGPVPSRGGRLREPYRRNLIAYLREIRRLGFARLSIAFGPQWSNNPRNSDFDPRKIEENWRFIQDIRGLTKRHGPSQTRFDLLNEGAPTTCPAVIRRQVTDYISLIYSRYVNSFGIDDVVVSAIAPRGARDRGDRLKNLIDSFLASGKGQPRWYEVHLNFPPDQVLFGLLAVDDVLTEHHLSQPIVIGEAPYNDPAVARAIDAFLQQRPRRIDEITQWFKRPNRECEVSPPYSARAYLDLRSHFDPADTVAGNGRPTPNR